MTDALRITTLGGLEILRGGEPIHDFALRKSEALLIYLAVTGRSHSREALAGLLWGEATESHARAYLRRVLAELRQHVGPFLTITRREVTFNPACPHWLDVAAFERAVFEATGVTQIPLSEPSVAALTDAVELYQGNFLHGFHVRQALAFEEWSLLERERLALSALRALHSLTDHFTALEDYTRAVTYTERLLALEPGQEEAHRSKMTLLALSGQQGAALRQFDVCRRLLAEELGVAPDASTRALYEQIKAGNPVRLRRRPSAPPHSVATPLTPLVGREAELAAIIACLGHPACRLLTLVGPGGSGKTRLALEAAAGLSCLPEATPNLTSEVDRRLFEHGVHFIPLESLDSGQAIVHAVAQSIGFAFHKGTESRQQLVDYLRQKRVLLVLDNFEHLLDDAQPLNAVSLVTEILEAAPGVKIMVTSRSRLKTGYEHILQLGGLDFPGEEALQVFSEAPSHKWEGIADYSGVQLFVSSARRVRPDEKLAADEIINVAHICRLVEGMPLAILLAAGWARMLTPAEIAARLSDHVSAADIHGLDFLQTDWRDVPARQRSMRAVFDHSWRLLTEREQELFAALSVFRGGFTGEAAWQVGGASLQELMALVDKSMLHRAAACPSGTPGTGGRYKTHKLLREYAAEKLADTPSAAGAVRHRHCAYYTAALRKWGADLRGSRQQMAMTKIEADLRNAHAAWDWAAEQGHTTQLDQAMDALCYFYKWRGRYEEGERACRIVTEGISASAVSETTEEAPATSPDRLPVLAKALAWQGVFNWRLGRAERASRLLSESLSLLERPVLAELDTDADKAFILWRLGRMNFDVDRERVGPLYEESLALYRALDARWGMANVLEDLGWVSRYMGVYGDASAFDQECLALRRALGDQRGISRSLRGLGASALRRGRLEEAERWMQESSAILQQTGYRADAAAGLSGLGWIQVMNGKFVEGHARIEESVALWNDLGLSNMVAINTIPLGFAKMHLGHYEQARSCVETGLGVARKVGDRGRTGFALLLRGWVALAQGAYAEAGMSLRECIATFQEIGQREEVGCGNAMLGYAARGLGQPHTATQHLHEALRVAAELRVFFPVLFALPAVALRMVDSGEPGRADELYALASRYPFVANSRWFEDVVSGHIAAAGADLPPGVVAAAQERGTSRNLWDTAEELVDELG